MSAGAVWSVRPGEAPAGGAAASAAGSFTIEQVATMRGERSRLTVLLTVDGVSLADADRVGVVLDPLTGQRRDAPRARSVSLDEALGLLRTDDHADARRLWGLCAPKGKIPGKVWALVGELMHRWGEPFTAAWAMAWTVDARQLREATDSCGTMTREVVHVDSEGRRSVGLSRARCGSARCPHCGVLVVGSRWKRRLVAQAEADRAVGEPWAFLTLTLDPAAWCEAHGVGPGVTSAVMAQRWVGRAFADLARDIRRMWPGTVMLRAMELHASQWPHVHVLVRGGLVRAMREEGAPRWDTWDEMATWAKDQRARQRAGELRVARCPTPTTRREVAQLATLRGFGLRLDLAPVPMADMEAAAEYAGKGPQAHGKAKRIVDVETPDSIVGELTKGRQRVGNLLARGVRCWAESGPFLTATPPEPDEAVEGIVGVRVIATPLDVLVRELRAAGQEVAGEVVMVDFQGPVPDKGERRPRVLEAAAVDVEVLQLLEDVGRRLSNAGDAARAKEAGPARPPPAAAPSGPGASPGTQPRPGPRQRVPPPAGPPIG